MKAIALVKVLAASVLALLMVLSGCTKAGGVPGSQTTTTAVPNGAAAPYGELRVGTGDFGDDSLDPIMSGPLYWSGLIYEFPIVTKPGTNQLAPGQIEKWEMAPDGLSWVFTLRKGLKFHNGDGLTSKDLKFSLDRACSPDAVQQYNAQMIDHVEIMDDYAVRVYTKGPQPYMAMQLSILSNNPFITPKNYFEKVGVEYFTEHPVGAGPWKFSSRVGGDYIAFEGFDMGWRPAPAFKTLKVVYLPEEATRVAMLRTNAIDVSDMALSRALELQKSGFRTTDMAPISPMIDLIGAFHPLAAKMPTGDLRVRQALSLAINREEIMKSFFSGAARPPSAPFAPADTPADVDVVYWKDYAAKNYRYDPAAAQQLLKDAGYSSGFTIKFLTHEDSGIPDMPKLAEVVGGYWLKVGVKSEFVIIDDTTWNQLRNPVRSPTDWVGSAATYKMSVSGNIAKQMDGGFRSKGSNGLLGDNAEIDKLIASAYTEMDQAKRQAIIAQIIKAGFDGYSALVLCEVPTLAVLGPNVDLQIGIYCASLMQHLEDAKHK